MIDTHCHLDFKDFDSDRSEVIERAFKKGVTSIITIGCDSKRSKMALDIASEYENIYPTIGIHPNSWEEIKDGKWKIIEDLAQENKDVIVGFGETKEQVLQTLRDLHDANVDIVTLGQYLKPKTKHLPVKEWVTPSTFDFYKQEALKLGFKFCASGPLVRSSYKAGELFVKHVLKRKS